MFSKCILIVFVSTCLTFAHVTAKADKLKFSPEIYKEVFGENEIFFAPGTSAAVPLLSKSADTNSLINRSRGVYGWLPCFCFVGVCNCCVDIQIRSLNTRDTSCISVAPVNDDNKFIETGLSLNNKTLIQQRISFDNAPPLCVPFPPFPAISLCVRLNEVMREDRNIRACVNFELRITGTLNPLWTLQFTCVRFGFNGISFFRPTTPVVASLTPSEVEVPSQEQEQLQQVVIPSAAQESPPFFLVHQFVSIASVPSSPETAPQPLQATTVHVMRMPVPVLPPPPPTPHMFAWPLDLV